MNTSYTSTTQISKVLYYERLWNPFQFLYTEEKIFSFFYIPKAVSVQIVVVYYQSLSKILVYYKFGFMSKSRLEIQKLGRT